MLPLSPWRAAGLSRNNARFFGWFQRRLCRCSDASQMGRRGLVAFLALRMRWCSPQQGCMLTRAMPCHARHCPSSPAGLMSSLPAHRPLALLFSRRRLATSTPTTRFTACIIPSAHHQFGPAGTRSSDICFASPRPDPLRPPSTRATSSLAPTAEPQCPLS